MRRLFLLVSAVVLVDTAFYAAISPLLPQYESELGLSKTAAGVLTASYAAGTLVGSLPGGWLASRVGVKPTLLTGLSLLAVTSVVFGFGNNIVVLDTARFFQGVGGACTWAAGLAWLVGVAPPDRRGELIGGALAAAIVGVFFGPVIGGLATVTSPELVFSSAALLAGGLALWALSTPGVAPGEGGGIGAVGPAFRRPAVRTAFWLFTLPAIYAGAIEVLAPLRLDDLGASGVAIGAVFLIAAAVEATITPVIGRASDRRGRLVPIRIGLVGAAAMAVLLPLPGTVVLFALVLVASIGALGTFWAPAMALLSDASEEAGLEQSIAFGIANLAWALGHVAGGGAGGALADATSDALPYSLLAATCVATFVGLSRRRVVTRS